MTAASQQQMPGMTPRQEECLEAIRKFQACNGVMPSISDLRLELGAKSRSSVHRLLKQLEACGAIRRSIGLARAIRLVQLRCPHCGEALP